jgi:hypothetical protein
MIRLDRIFSSRSDAAKPDPDPVPSGTQPPPPGDEAFAERLRRAIAQPALTPEEPDTPHRRLPPDAAFLRPGQPMSQTSLPEPAVSNVQTANIPDLFVPAPEPLPDTAGSPAVPVPPDPTPDLVPPPPVPLPERRAGRVRTRLLGHDHVQNLVTDPIEAARAAPAPAQGRFPVGWVVVTDGPGKGSFFSLFNGVSQVGRGADQTVRLDFGDMSISRNNHAAIAYDDEANAFFLGHGGKANLVRLNHRPVVSTEPMHHLDMIRLGETTLRFVALCKDDFRWDAASAGGSSLV